MTDPFAPYANDSDVSFETSTTNTKENKNMAETTENNGKMTITLKGGTGFDAPWIVIHAADAADGLEQMKDPQLAELMDIVKRAGQHFGGGKGEPQAQAPQGKPGQPQGSTQPSNGEGRTCAHGQMTYREGISKAGKAYKAFFCPERDRNAQCKAQFLN